jgi:hypothetical protein
MNFSKATKCKGCEIEFTPKRGVRYCTPECCETSKRIESHYGINKAEYDFIWSLQGSQCAICNATEGNMVVDHCHDTGKIRGILCQHCNTGLGAFRDDTEALQRAIGYVTHAEYVPADGQPRVGRRTLAA